MIEDTRGMVPPQATDIEEAILAGCMLESHVIPDVITTLTPACFYRLEHQYIFEAITKLHEESNPVDILTVVQHLKNEGKLELVGGAYYVSQLTDRVASGANAEYHAKIVHEKHMQRELIRISGEAYGEAFLDTTDPIDLLEKTSSQLTDIASSLSAGGNMSMGELAKEVIHRAELASNGEIIGLRTNLRDVDQLTGGYREANFIILAARSGMGKTSKALQEAYEFGVKQRKRTLFFSVEMTAVQLMLRLVSLHTGIPAWKIREGSLSEDEWGVLNAEMQEIIDSELIIIDDCLKLHEIRNRIVAEKHKNDIEIVYVDYLQRVQNSGKGKNREQEVAEISTTLANVSKKLNIPLIALAQLSRDVEKRGGDKKPQMSDLRESGSIEQDAHIIAFLYRPEYYKIDMDDNYGSTDGLCLYLVEKNREGKTGEVAIRFHSETTSFSEWEEPSLTAPSPNDIPDNYRSPMPRSEEFDDLDDLDDTSSQGDMGF